MITAKVLVNASYASASAATVYTVPSGTRTIIDKFTASSNSGTPTLTVYIVPSGQAIDNAYKVVVGKTLTTPASGPDDITAMKNQILAAGDTIQVLASAASTVVIRVSGREVT